MGSRQFCRGRGRGRSREVEAEARAARFLTEARQGRGRGRELEAEAKQTKFEARPMARRPVVELRWGPKGPGPPERPDGTREASVLRGFKGPVKGP